MADDKKNQSNPPVVCDQDRLQEWLKDSGDEENFSMLFGNDGNVVTLPNISDSFEFVDDNDEVNIERIQIADYFETDNGMICVYNPENTSKKSNSMSIVNKIRSKESGRPETNTNKYVAAIRGVVIARGSHSCVKEKLVAHITSDRTIQDGDIEISVIMPLEEFFGNV